MDLTVIRFQPETPMCFRDLFKTGEYPLEEWHSIPLGQFQKPVESRPSIDMNDHIREFTNLMKAIRSADKYCICKLLPFCYTMPIYEIMKQVYKQCML